MRSRSTIFAAAVAYFVVLPVLHASGQVTLFHDRLSFETAIAGLGTTHTDDYESYPLGDIPLGGVRGDFAYTFDQSITQPAVVPGGNGGQALGGSPFDVFVGGDAVTLTAGAGSALRAFGADFLYAPAFDTIPTGTYQLSIADGSAAGHFIGSLDTIDPGGGTFFLGLIVDPAFEFASVNFLSVQTDPNFVVPAWQVDNLIYAGNVVPSGPGVPEPGAPTVVAAIAVILSLRGRARRIAKRR